MAHTTTRRGLRVPDLADNPDVPRDIGNLGSDLDATMAGFQTGTLAARSAATPKDGDLWWATDDTRMSPNGSLAKWDAANGTWRDAFHPNDPAAGVAGARTLGTGAAQAAAGNDGRLSDPRTPTTHAGSHRPGGADALANMAASARQVLDTGIANQIRAGRALTLTDFTVLLGLSAPLGLWNLSDLTDASGNARALTNRGAVAFTTGITGAAGEAAQFTGGDKALYRVDAGGADPFRIQTGSWGCWFRTPKHDGTGQMLISKDSTIGTNRGYFLWISGNVLQGNASGEDGASSQYVTGSTDVCDDRWHYGVVTFDGTMLRLYVDGLLETSVAWTASMAGSTAPLNIGARSSDGATAAQYPHFGRIDEAFISADVLNEDQIRMLYAAKFAHGSPVTPNLVNVNVRRRRKGAVLTAADFSATPLRLHNLNNSTADLGSNGVFLTANGGVGSKNPAGPDGQLLGAVGFDGVDDYYSATDAGLPIGTASRSYGAWFKTINTAGTTFIISYGTATAGQVTELAIQADGSVYIGDGAASTIGPIAYNDGQWHLVVAQVISAPADGLIRRLYIDGKLVASATTAWSATVSGGAGKFRIGANWSAAPGNFFKGNIARAFVANYAMSSEEINGLYAKGAVALPASPKNEGDHVEAIDATNLYVVCDTLGSQDQIDLRVAA